MIKVENLEMSYGSFKALDKISFEVNQGEVVGLLGPNGAGKSTTMKILTTYLHPENGKATVAGYDVVENPLEVRARIGYLPEVLPLYSEMEVKEYLEFVGRSRSVSGAKLTRRLEWVVDTLGLTPMYRKLCRELSKGYRQRVGLAQALLHDPEIVILDEPTSGLDPHQIQEIRILIRTLGQTKTVILSTHVLREAEAVSDRIVIINRGKIVGDGTLDELKTRAHHQEKTFIAVMGERDAVENCLSQLDGVKQLNFLSQEGSYLHFEITADSGRRIWNSVGEAALKNNWQIGLLKDMPHSLEETFMTLTGGGSKGGQA